MIDHGIIQINGGLRLTLPWPPSVNAYWRSIPMRSKRSGKPVTRVLVSAKGRRYRDEISGIVLYSHPSILGIPYVGDLAVRLWMAPPDKRGRDIDNYRKALFDALTHAGVWRDDSQIKRDAAVWCHPVRHGQIVMAIDPLQTPVEAIPDAVCI